MNLWSQEERTRGQLPDDVLLLLCEAVHQGHPPPTGREEEELRARMRALLLFLSGCRAYRVFFEARGCEVILRCAALLGALQRYIDDSRLRLHPVAWHRQLLSRAMLLQVRRGEYDRAAATCFPALNLACYLRAGDFPEQLSGRAGSGAAFWGMERMMRQPWLLDEMSGAERCEKLVPPEHEDEYPAGRLSEDEDSTDTSSGGGGGEEENRAAYEAVIEDEEMWGAFNRLWLALDAFITKWGHRALDAFVSGGHSLGDITFHHPAANPHAVRLSDHALSWECATPWGARIRLPTAGGLAIYLTVVYCYCRRNALLPPHYVTAGKGGRLGMATVFDKLDARLAHCHADALALAPLLNK